MSININTTGYTRGSATEKNSHNFIPSRYITMKNVDKPLTLIPVVNGKPQYDKKVVANPGDPDIDFGEGVEGVLELPYAQSQYGMLNNPFNMEISPFSQNDNAPYTTTPAVQNATVPNRGNNFGVKVNNPGIQNKGLLLNSKKLQEDANKPLFGYVSGSIDTNVPTYNEMALKAVNPITDPTYGMKKTAVELDKTKKQSDDFFNKYETPKQQGEQQGEQEEQEDEDGLDVGERFRSAGNPYGGWNMANSAAALGAFIQAKNPLGIVASAGKLLTSGLRAGLSGSAAMRRYKGERDAYNKAMVESVRNRDLQYAQKGGLLLGGKGYAKEEAGRQNIQQPGKLLTGNFLEGNPEHPNPNSELERGEYVQTPDGNTMEILGNKHSEGGELLNLPPNTKVISDYLKIGAKLAKFFKDEFGLNVTAKSTFATVLDKYKKKIGFDEILEEEADLMEKIADQEAVKYESTREVNLQVLSKKANELQTQKQPLEEKFNEFTNLVFEKQESQKIQDTLGGKYQEGGEVPPEQQQLMDMIAAYAQMNNQDPQELMKQLSEMPEEERNNALRQIMLYVQQGAQSEVQNEQQPAQQVMQGGGMGNPQPQPQEQGQEAGMTDAGSQLEQIVTKFAEVTGQTPEEVVKQLQQLSDEQMQQAFQKMIQIIQQAEQDKGTNITEPLSDEQVEAEANEEYKQDTPVMMAEGGTLPGTEDGDEDNYDPYIANIIKSGRSVLGGSGDGIYNPGALENTNAFLAGTRSWGILNNEYNILADRLEGKLKKAKTDTERFNILDKGGQGDRQGLNHRNVGEDALAYSGMGHAPVQKALQYVYDTNSPEENAIFLHALKESGIKVVNGKIVPGGFYKTNAYYSKDNSLRKYFDAMEQNNPNRYKKIGVINVTDGVWDRRYETLHQLEFDTAEQRDKYFQKKNFKKFKMNNGDDIWIDPENRNNFIISKIKDKPVTPEEPPKEEPPAPEDPKNPDPKANIKKPGKLNQNYTDPFPHAIPDQSNLPPIYLPTRMRQIGHVEANKLAISPEESLKELNAQTQTASRVLAEVNPNAFGAGQANLQAQLAENSNKAISQAAIANQQDARNVDNINEGRINQRDATNLNLADKYERESIVGRNNYYNEWVNYWDNANRQNVVNWNLQNEINAYNAINPNFQIGSDGSIYQTDRKDKLYVNGFRTGKNERGEEVLYDENGRELSGEARNKIIASTLATGKMPTPPKSTTAPKKKKGGLLMRR